MGIKPQELKSGFNNFWRNKMAAITIALDDKNQAAAFKLANEAVNIKFTKLIIEGLSTEDNLVFT